MMDAGRKIRRKEKREKDIIEGARKVFTQRGYENTTMKDIAKGLDISVGSVYIYFNNKDELYYAVIKEGLRTMTEMFSQAASTEGTGLDQFASIGMAYVRFWNEYPQYRKLLHGACPPIGPNGGRWGKECFDLNTQRMGILVQTLLKGIKDGSIRKDLDAVSAAFCVAGAFHGVLSALDDAGKDIGKKGGVSEEDVVMSLFDLFRTSLRSDKGKIKGGSRR